MSPREAFGVVVRSFGLFAVLYGVNALVTVVIASITFSDVSSSFPSEVQVDAILGPLTSNVAGQVFKSGCALACFWIFCGIALILYSRCLADFVTPSRSSANSTL